MEMSRLTRDEIAEPVSRDQILRHERGQGNIHFSCSADHVQDWQPYPVDPYSCYMCDHTCMRPENHTQLANNCLRPFFVFCFSFFFCSLEMSLFPSVFVPLPCSLINSMESSSYVLPFRVAFFYLVTTGWIFDISLSQNQLLY